MIQLALIHGMVPEEYLPGTAAEHAAGAALPGFRPATVGLKGCHVVYVDESVPAGSGSLLDATGCVILPGFMDMHVHGAVGHDTMDADVSGLATMARHFAASGVTGFLPTTLTASHQDTLTAVRAVAAMAGGDGSGAKILGVHLEGPYISPDYPGAQPPDQIRPPNLAELVELVSVGPVRMITLAPERPGARAMIEEAMKRGIGVVLGHTSATYEEARLAIDWGVSQATHTYNAMSGLHHRRPGTLGAVLSDGRIFAQLIADNIHVHPAAMKILALCKGTERTLLISDAMRAAGLPPGIYDLGGQRVTVQEGECRLDDGTLAGSVLSMDRALVNFMSATGLDLAQAWPVSSRTPAKALGIDAELGELRPGYRADLVLLDARLDVVATLVDGRIVHLRDRSRLRLDPGHDDLLRTGRE